MAGFSPAFSLKKSGWHIYSYHSVHSKPQESILRLDVYISPYRIVNVHVLQIHAARIPINRPCIFFGYSISIN